MKKVLDSFFSPSYNALGVNKSKAQITSHSSVTASATKSLLGRKHKYRSVQLDVLCGQRRTNFRGFSMVAGFVSEALYTKRPIGAKRFHVSKPLIFYSEILGREIIAPEGFETDFASIPWFLQSIIQVNGPHIHAAVIHDLLCEYRDVFGITQKQADEVLLEAMQCLGVRITQRSAMYLGVRLYQSAKGVFK
jgi:hypothetical protein